MSNPYRPPAAPVGDAAPAVLTTRQLMRWYQALVVAATLLGLVQFTGLLQLFLPPDLTSLRGIDGAGALIPVGVTDSLYIALQILWIASAIGLCFFTWWARPLFVGTYTLSAFVGLTGGVQIAFPLDSFVLAIATLMDGAILALSFLPPISSYFSRERRGA